MAVYRQYLPVVGVEAFGGVVAKPVFDLAIDRDAIVVIKNNEFAQFESACERANLVRDALHEAAVAGEYVGVVVDYVETWAVKLRTEGFFGDCHANRVSEALAERPGCGLDAGRVAVFWVAGGLRIHLSKLLDVFNRHVVAGEVQQRVNKHRAVAVRKHKTVSIQPLRIAWAVAQMVFPQHFGNVCHAHRSAGVA